MDGPADRDALIQQFCSFTAAPPSDAEPLLASHDWNVEAAVSTWFASQEGDGDGQTEEAGSDLEMDEPPAAQRAPQPPPTNRLVMGGGRTLGGGAAPSEPSESSRQTPASTTSRARPQRGGLRTLKDLQGGEHAGHGHGHDDESDDEHDPDQDFFAGGEKSGLAVQNPSHPGNARDHINSILDRARRAVPRPGGDDPEPEQTRFSGRGVTLGGDEAPSEVVEDPTATATGPPRLSRVRRVLHLWSEGFSVDDGPLFRYDDPANTATLNMINQGHAPLDLLNVQATQEVDLELDNQKDNAYVQPKKKYVPFSGSGQRLGSPTPGVSPAPPPPTPVQPGTATPSSTAAPSVDVSSSQPTIMLQIRLGDGTRLQSRFNTTHTVGDVYGFVNAASTASSQRPYALMTTFPSKDLDDPNVKLGDLPEFKRGGVVVQKWK